MNIQVGYLNDKVEYHSTLENEYLGRKYRDLYYVCVYVCLVSVSECEFTYTYACLSVTTKIKCLCDGK